MNQVFPNVRSPHIHLGEAKQSFDLPEHIYRHSRLEAKARTLSRAIRLYGLMVLCEQYSLNDLDQFMSMLDILIFVVSSVEATDEAAEVVAECQYTIAEGLYLLRLLADDFSFDFY